MPTTFSITYSGNKGTIRNPWERKGTQAASVSFSASLLGRIIPAILSWASRLSLVTACAYVPSVMTGEECPHEFLSSLHTCARGLKQCCEGTAERMPSRSPFQSPAPTAAGRICLVSRVFAQYGFSPRLLDWRIPNHSALRTRFELPLSESFESSTFRGRGRFEPTVFVLPTT